MCAFSDCPEHAKSQVHRQKNTIHAKEQDPDFHKPDISKQRICTLGNALMRKLFLAVTRSTRS